MEVNIKNFPLSYMVLSYYANFHMIDKKCLELFKKSKRYIQYNRFCDLWIYKIKKQGWVFDDTTPVIVLEDVKHSAVRIEFTPFKLMNREIFLSMARTCRIDVLPWLCLSYWKISKKSNDVKEKLVNVLKSKQLNKKRLCIVIASASEYLSSVFFSRDL